ncbi:unnamed protein product [Schistosoma mattheei]|uniref:Uncharacterized protein n=1 Tax=Schistosoma mattheei TaxID=31246 RepID=A0A183PQ03_9TREM|nr:unnamed protein product [Schistosoma mattheei]
MYFSNLDLIKSTPVDFIKLPTRSPSVLEVQLVLVSHLFTPYSSIRLITSTFPTIFTLSSELFTIPVEIK